jgi:hypothetical protein
MELARIDLRRSVVENLLTTLPLINGRRVGLLDHRRLIDQMINLVGPLPFLRTRFARVPGVE